jgi:hypothetical protein
VIGTKLESHFQCRERVNHTLGAVLPHIVSIRVVPVGFSDVLLQAPLSSE